MLRSNRFRCTVFSVCLLLLTSVILSLLYFTQKLEQLTGMRNTLSITSKKSLAIDLPSSTLLSPLHDVIDVGSHEKSPTTLEKDDKTILFGNASTSIISTSSSRPKLILHMGPPKTSTTTIQCALGHKDMQEMLNQENYYYIGSFITYCSYGNMNKFVNQTVLQNFHYHTFYSCLASKHVESLETSCKDRIDGKYAGKFQEFKGTFDYHRKLGHNLIYSSEHLSKLPINEDPEILTQLEELFDGFDVEVVFTYRDYFAFLVSVFYQSFRNKYTARRAIGWQGRIPPFARELDAYLTNTTLSEGPDARNAVFHEDINENLLYIENNSNQYFNVKYFRMEQQNDYGLMTNFVCQMIPEAANACSHFKDNDDERNRIAEGENQSSAGKKSKVENAATENELEADMLATALFEKGWVDPDGSSCKRIPLQRNLRQFLNDMKLAGSYPQQCATKLDELLHLSNEMLDRAIQSFGEEEGKSMKDAMMEKWSDYIKAKKFCTLDIDSFIIEMENELKKRIEELSCTAAEG